MEKERFDEWFEAHFADWLRAMRGGFRHDDIQQFRDSLLTAWSAALRGQASGVVPEDAEAFRSDAAVRVKLGPTVAEWLDGDPAP